jgi:hypothetical protein
VTGVPGRQDRTYPSKPINPFQRPATTASAPDARPHQDARPRAAHALGPAVPRRTADPGHLCPAAVGLPLRPTGRQDSGSSSIRKPRIGEGACGMPGFGCGGTPGLIGAMVWVIWLIAEPAMAGAGCGIAGFGAAAA